MTITITAPSTTATVTIETIKATVPIKAKIDRLREVRAVKSAAEAEAKALTAEILEFAGPVGKFINWGKTRLATIVNSTSAPKVDFETLARLYPRAYSLCVTPGTPYKQVR